MKTKNQVSDMKVSEVMTKRVETLTPSNTIRDAVNLMLDCKVSTVPVVDIKSRCIGIVSRSDFTEMFVQEENELSHILDTDRLSLDWLNRSLDTGDVRQIKELMTYDVATVKLGETLARACTEMAKHHIHHLPVVDDEQRVVGIISSFDVVMALAVA